MKIERIGRIRCDRIAYNTNMLFESDAKSLRKANENLRKTCEKPAKSTLKETKKSAKICKKAAKSGHIVNERTKVTQDIGRTNFLENRIEICFGICYDSKVNHIRVRSRIHTRAIPNQ